MAATEADDPEQWRREIDLINRVLQSDQRSFDLSEFVASQAARVSHLQQQPTQSVDQRSIQSGQDGGGLARSINSSSQSHGAGGDRNSQSQVQMVNEFEEAMSLLTEGALPASTGTVLALNQAYQDLLASLVGRVEGVLAQNRERQRTLNTDLEQCKAGTMKMVTKVPNQLYLPPYFRDSSGMAPPLSDEAKLKAAQGEYNPLVQPPKKWFKMEKEKLYKGVKESALEQKLKSCLNKRDILIEKLQATQENDTETISELRAQSSKISKEIAHIKSMKDEELFAAKPYEIDWMRVATHDLEGTRTAKECQLYWEQEVCPLINQDTRWSKEELRQLKRMVEEQAMNDWDKIAKVLSTNRTAFQCFEKYQSELNDGKLRKKWDRQEDDKLRQVIEDARNGDYIPWDTVAYYMEGRTRTQVQMRWVRTLDPKLKRGKWTEQEDLLVTAAVKKYGPRDWAKIAELVPGRTDSQCRERWHSTLDINVKVGLWTKQEDDTLLYAVSLFGASNWAKVSKLLPGRPPTQCKTRHRSLVRLMEDATQPGKKRRRKTVVSNLQKRAKLASDAAAAAAASANSSEGAAANNGAGGEKGSYEGDVLAFNRIPLDAYAKSLDRAFSHQTRKEKIRRLFERMGGVYPEFEQEDPEIILEQVPENARELIRQKLSQIRETSDEDYMDADERGVSEHEHLKTEDELDAEILAVISESVLPDAQFDALLPWFDCALHNMPVRPLPPTIATLQGFLQLLIGAKRFSLQAANLLGNETEVITVNDDANLLAATAPAVTLRGYAQEHRAVEEEQSHSKDDAVKNLTAMPWFTLGSEAGTDQGTNNGAKSPVSSPQGDWLAKLVRFPEYKKLRSRFKALFAWPALMSSRVVKQQLLDM